MAAHKHNYNVTDIAALEAAYPRAVETEKKPVRSVITKLLDCGVTVPGIELLEAAPEPTATPTPAAAEPAEKKPTVGEMLQKSKVLPV